MKFLFPLLAVLISAALPAHAQDGPPVQILNKTEKQIQKEGAWQNVVETSPSRYRVGDTKVFYWNDALAAYVFTERVPDAELQTLAIRVGERVFTSVASAQFANGDKALLIAGLDSRSAAILRGETSDLPLQKQLSLKWQPIEEKPGQVIFSISNVGKTPLMLSYGMNQNDEGPARDSQMTFFAKREGKPVSGSSKELPTGAWSAPETIEPGASWERIVDLRDYLALAQTGHYEVEAHYTLRVQNPDAKAKGGPTFWSLGFDGTFNVDQNLQTP